jgi:thiamine-phosphate pyrophosphorylase
MEKKTLRIIDANFNRAREGLRVIEDGLRFYYDRNKDYVRQLKKIRHSLSEGIEKNFGFSTLKKERDSYYDIGKDIDNREKETVRQVIERNFMRVGEALRTLEEYSKTTVPEASLLFHNLRFDLYEIEKDVTALLDRSNEKN